MELNIHTVRIQQTTFPKQEEAVNSSMWIKLLPTADRSSLAPTPASSWARMRQPGSAAGAKSAARSSLTRLPPESNHNHGSGPRDGICTGSRLQRAIPWHAAHSTKRPLPSSAAWPQMQAAMSAWLVFNSSVFLSPSSGNVRC